MGTQDLMTTETESQTGAARRKRHGLSCRSPDSQRLIQVAGASGEMQSSSMPGARGSFVKKFGPRVALVIQIELRQLFCP